ncbi:MAG TPA: metal ABC transporter substrate-binding protein [Candidatus Limnocylindrales bacterium]|nr:metal ABC transporter substrate-binding protein [Candidatus Limnocylindrales bacterium]
MRPRFGPVLVAAAVAAIGLSACGPSPSSGAPGSTVSVVTTTTVFADMISNVGGAYVHVTSLAGKNADVHTFEPKPADIQTIANAKLLVMNGLGLDDWLERAITNGSASGTPLVKLGVDLPSVELLPGEGPGTQNPHLWMDVKYAELYVDRIAAALKSVDPARARPYDNQAVAYKARLETVDAGVRSKIAAIPEANRRIVMFHDAFPYFAREYGITIVGVAVEAPGQDPSAGNSAELIRAIRDAGVKAIFSESQFPTKLLDELASETGAKVVANLYDDALGDPPVTSYEALIGWDVDQLVTALR